MTKKDVIAETPVSQLTTDEGEKKGNHGLAEHLRRMEHGMYRRAIEKNS